MSVLPRIVCANTAQAEETLADVFRRFDIDESGGLNKREYDLLVSITDGEPSDEETWSFIVGMNSTKQDNPFTFVFS